MDPIRPPRPQEIVPGAVFRDQGTVIEIQQGKHGPDDLRVVVNGRAISHQGIATLIVAIYMAEERYLAKKKKGGDYFFTHLDSWIYWTRSLLGKPANPLYPRADVRDKP